jgi:hypothetical protein
MGTMPSSNPDWASVLKSAGLITSLFGMSLFLSASMTGSLIGPPSVAVSMPIGPSIGVILAFSGTTTFFIGAKLDERIRTSKKWKAFLDNGEIADIYDLPNCTLVYGSLTRDDAEGTMVPYGENTKKYFDKIGADPRKPIVAFKTKKGYVDTLNHDESLAEELEKRFVLSGIIGDDDGTGKGEAEQELQTQKEVVEYDRSRIRDYPYVKRQVEFHEMGHVDSLAKTGLMDDYYKIVENLGDGERDDAISYMEQHAIIYELRGILRNARRGDMPTSKARDMIRHSFFTYIDTTSGTPHQPHRTGFLRILGVDYSPDADVKKVLSESSLAAKLYNLSEGDIPGLILTLDKKDEDVKKSLRKIAKESKVSRGSS